ncbi:MAG TPA: Ig-like domain-containing protein [Gemmatimonadota bacterium]|jgi:hypothetical protein
MGLRSARFPLVIGLVAMGGPAVAGCDDSTTLVLDHEPAIRIVIDSSRCPRVEKCGQCQLDFEAFDKNFQPAEFPTIIWTSLNPSVATVTSQGRVNGWATGGVSIVAEVLETGAADTVSIPVVPPTGPITCTPPGSVGAR